MSDSEPLRDPRGPAWDAQRSVEAGGVVDTLMTMAMNPATYVVPGAYVAGKVVDAVKDVMVAKASAEASVDVARIENGYPDKGGSHRAE